MYMYDTVASLSVEIEHQLAMAISELAVRPSTLTPNHAMQCQCCVESILQG